MARLIRPAATEGRPARQPRPARQARAGGRVPA